MKLYFSLQKGNDYYVNDTNTIITTTSGWLSGMNGHLRNVLWDPEVTGWGPGEEL